MAPKGQIAPDQFDEATHWGVWNFLTNAPGWSRIGWEMPNDSSRYYSRDDGYWTTVRDKARVAYGDPSIGYNTDFPGFDRYLVFGDGTRVPDDGKIVYRDLSDPDNVKTWIQYDGGKKVALQGEDGEPVGEPKEPAAYQQFGKDKWFPVDEHGNQIGPQVAKVPETCRDRQPSENQDKNGDPKNGDPNEPKLTTSIPEGMVAPKYPDWAYDPAHGGKQTVADALATILVNLYSKLGSGERVPDKFSNFPVDVVTGANLGIDDYNTNSELSDGFRRLRTEYGEFITALNTAIDNANILMENSWTMSENGRLEVNDEIGKFNEKTAVMTVPNWDGLADAEAKVVDNVEKAIVKAATEQPAVNPLGNPSTPNTGVPGLGGGTDRRTPLTPSLNDGTSPLGGSTLSKDTDDSSTEDQISRLLSGLSAGLNTDTSTSNSSDGWSSGLSSALSGLSGLSNLSNLGTSLASSARPVDSIDRVDNDDEDEDDEKNDEKDEAVEPLAPPVTPTQGAQAQAIPGQPTVGEPQEGTVQPASAVAAAGPGAKLTVTLPDGRVVEAPNAQAAEAARNALADSDGSGDAAQKAYAGTGVEIPSDGKNPGAKVDPSDLQPGDIAKWEDKTMVVVAPGLLAVPGEPDSVITVAEALEKNARGEAQGGSTGFEGFYRPTETDPTLSAAASPPPLTDPQQPAPPVEDKAISPPAQPDSPSKSQPAAPPSGDESEPAAPPSDQQSPPPSQDPPVPQKDPQQESSPKAPTAPRAETNALVEPQPAPPSPFTPSPDVPPATRTTKQERIVAGQS